MKQVSTKKALIASVLSMLVCVSMLIGSTFAWFTDSASTNVNTIKSGNLDVDIVNETGDSLNGGTLEFKNALDEADVLWEPGATFNLDSFKIVNKGNLALKYQVIVSGLKGDSELLEVIDFTVKKGDAEPVALADWDGVLLPAGATVAAGAEVGETALVTISGTMRKDAGNEYMEKTLDGISIKVIATQYTYESDSNGNTYDEDAAYPVVAAATVADGSDTVAKDKDVDHNVKITAPASSLSDTVNKVYLTVVEKETPASIDVSYGEDSQSFDISLKDQDGRAVTATDGNLFEVEMQIGKNRLNVEIYHDGVLMVNDGAVLTETADHYVYDMNSGYVTMKVSHFSPFTVVYSTSWSKVAVEDYATAIDETEKVVTIASAEELALLAKQVNAGTNYKGYTVKLVTDIDLDKNKWEPIGKSGKAFQGVFDGQNHKISNLIAGGKYQSDVGLFGLTTGGEVKNFTLENADVTGYLDVGAIAGTPYTSKYTNIKLIGDVKINGYAYVGGMFGKNAYADLTDLTINVTEGSYVKADSQNYRTYVGGLVGFMGEGSQVVKNVTSNIDVIGSTCDVGGITGIAHYGNSFINCHSSGNVTLVCATDEGDELEIGGIAGVWLNQAKQTVTLEGCTFTGKLSSSNAVTGAVTEFDNNGLVGRKYNRTSNDGTLIIK